jgi:hypothetical protein
MPFTICQKNLLLSGQCEVLGKSTSLLGFQPPTSFNPLPDSQSLKGFQCKTFKHFIKMSDRELRTVQLGKNVKFICKFSPFDKYFAENLLI